VLKHLCVTKYEHGNKNNLQKLCLTDSLFFHAKGTTYIEGV